MTLLTGRVSLRWIRFLTVTATGLWSVYLVRTWVSRFFWRFEDFSLDLAGTNKLKISVKSNECSNPGRSPFLSNFNRDQACLNLDWKGRLLIGWIPRDFQIFIFKPNFLFLREKVTKMITRVNSRIFSDSSYIWFSRFFRKWPFR